MLDLLDCLMPACHEASAVTTPSVAGVTFVAVIALAVTGYRLAAQSVLGPGFELAPLASDPASPTPADR